MRVLALASYDSFLNTASLIAPHFRAAGCEVEYALVKARNKTQISEEQVRSFELDGPVRWIAINEFCRSGEISRYDIVLSCLDGLSTRRLVHNLAPLGERRPLIISSYPGLVLRYALDGYSMRTASDLVWLNCKVDYDEFCQMSRAFHLDGDNARIFGVAPLLRKVTRDPDASNGPLVFFEQAIIPRYHDERLFLAEQLVLLAKRFPTKTILIKPRTSGNDATLHQTLHDIADLLGEASQRHGGQPANLKLTMEKASVLLQSASHCLTVNSTVAVEAIHAKIPTIVLGDFGAHEEYGLSYFFGSGLIRNFAEIDLSAAAIPDFDWLSTHVADPNETVAALTQEAIEMARRSRKPIIEGMALRAELSPELRAYLTARKGAGGVIDRSYRKRNSILSRSLNFLSALRFRN